MKTNKIRSKKSQPKVIDEIGGTIHQVKKRNDKVKYKHKNYWLKDEDDDYEMPSYRDEEE